MSLIINVRESKVETKEGVGRNSGRPYRIREQPAFVTLPSGETRLTRLSLEGDAAPLAPGDYQPKPSAYWVGDFGAISVSNRAKHWEPVSVAAKQPPALARAV